MIQNCCSAPQRRSPPADSASTRLHSRAGPQVLVLQFQAAQPLGLLRPGQLRFCLLRQRQEVVSIPFAHGVRVPGVDELFLGVLAYRIQQPVAVAVLVGDHQRFLDEGDQQIDHIVLGDRLPGADELHRAERPAAGEDRQPREQRLFRRIEQVVAPVDQRPQRLVPRQLGTAAGRQQAKALVEQTHDLVDG